MRIMIALSRAAQVASPERPRFVAKARGPTGCSRPTHDSPCSFHHRRRSCLLLSSRAAARSIRSSRMVAAMAVRAPTEILRRIRIARRRRPIKAGAVRRKAFSASTEAIRARCAIRSRRARAASGSLRLAAAEIVRRLRKIPRSVRRRSKKRSKAARARTPERFAITRRRARPSFARVDRREDPS